MRIGELACIGFAVALAVPAVVVAQTKQPHNSPDDIVCRLSGSCGGSTADPSKQIQVGDEKAFSLAGTAGKPASPSAAPAGPSRVVSPPARHVAARPLRGATGRAPLATSNGGLDMMVNFANGSSELTDQGKVEVRAFAQALSSPKLAGMRFTIDGHTSATGARTLNQELSERRADAVKTYLVSLGVDSSRLETHGYGFDKPRPGTLPKDAANRRVEFGKAN